MSFFRKSTCRSSGATRFLLDASYKHMAALRPGPMTSHKLQQHTITSLPSNAAYSFLDVATICGLSGYSR